MPPTRSDFLIERLDSLPRVVRGTRTIRRLAAAIQTRSLSAATVALRLPDWAAELAGGVPAPARRKLSEAQLLFLCGILLQDSLLDKSGQADGVTGWDLELLLHDAERILAGVFAADSPFWRGYRKTLAHQVGSARWELTPRRSLPRLDVKLLRELSHKAALLRWPAPAVASLSGRAELGPRLDRAFGRLFAVLQIFDDLHDLEDDARSGQINAILCGMGHTGGLSAIDLSLRRSKAVRRAAALASAELSAVLKDVPAKSGLGRYCTKLLIGCAAVGRRAAGEAGARVLAEILAPPPVRGLYSVERLR